MTALCGGGSSGPKVGVAAVVDYSSGLIAAILAAKGLGWLIPIIPLAGLPPLILSTFCATDPPATPTFTSAETNAILQLQFGADFDSGISKLKDLLLNIIWDDACTCTSGAYTPFSPPPPPTGTPIFQPPLPPSVAACKVLTFDKPAQGGSPNTFGLSQSFLGTAATLITVTASNAIASGGGAALACSFDQQNAAGTVIASKTFTMAATQAPFTFSVLPVANAQACIINYTITSGTGTTHVHADVDFYCNGDQPGATQLPCCPPDVATQAYLDLILKSITLIQRQAVPFAYVTSTAHAGLSGAGTIAINGLIGASVEATTIPTSYGREGTAPTEYFDMGFLTFGTADGYPSAYRMDRQKRLLLPARCGAYTELDYDLAPGVVVTITELTREP